MQDREQKCKQDRALETKAPADFAEVQKKHCSAGTTFCETILVSRSIEVAESGQLAPGEVLVRSGGIVPADSRDFGKAGKFAGLHVAEANGFADGSTKLRARSNGFDDKRSETSNAGGKRG
jgi:hypothetical protein